MFKRLFKDGKLVVFAAVGLIVFATSVSFAHAADAYAVARVVSATERVVQQCTQGQSQPQMQQQQTDSGSMIPAVLGGVFGAVVGNQVGGGQGRVIATSAGAAVGAIIGTRYGGGNTRYVSQPAPQPQQQCSYQTVGYEVTYDLNGIVGKGFVPYRPGNTINVGLTAM